MYLPFLKHSPSAPIDPKNLVHSMYQSPIYVHERQNNIVIPRHWVRKGLSTLVLCLCAVLLSGCGPLLNWLPSAGPSRNQVLAPPSDSADLPIQVVEVTEPITRVVLAQQKRHLFSETFGNNPPLGYIVGPGDVLVISIWESPPAVLFGSATLTAQAGANASNVTAFPPQMVSNDGTVNIPFAGRIPAAKLSPQQIEAAIVQSLSGKANHPQVLVRVAKNATSNVTVVGEVGQSTRVPLTAQGEKLLDALASAGGVRQQVGKISLQVTRGEKVQTLPLDTIIRDPKQNIVLQPGDVITALYQPSSFTVLGAVKNNAEINFEAQGITLSQALGRAGGLLDTRADARAVFIFRKELPNTVPWTNSTAPTPDNKIPVIYQINLKEPASFFIAQSFPIQDADILYVSTSPATELQKFLSLLASPLTMTRQVEVLSN